MTSDPNHSGSDLSSAYVTVSGIAALWLVFYLLLLGHAMTSSFQQVAADTSPQQAASLSADASR